MQESLMEALKKACKDRHGQIRAGLYAGKIMQQLITLTEYQCLLLANYWFHSYMESKFDQYLSEEWKEAIEYPLRMKSRYAFDDLRRLGIDATQIPCPIMPAGIFNREQALGALYVAEGTAIGGAVIRKNLLKVPEIASGDALQFYGCYGKELSRLWKSFEHFMHHMKASSQQMRASVHAALSMFNLYEFLLEEAEKALPERNQAAA